MTVRKGSRRTLPKGNAVTGDIFINEGIELPLLVRQFTLFTSRRKDQFTPAVYVSSAFPTMISVAMGPRIWIICNLALSQTTGAPSRSGWTARLRSSPDSGPQLLAS